MPAISGKEYIQRIDQKNTEIWCEGKKVTGKISEHPAFKGIIKSQAKLFDYQLRTDARDFMLWRSDKTGHEIGVSFLPPKTKEDLEKRRLATQAWARLTHGMLGRSPDYMNTALMAFGTSADMLKDQDETCAQNMKNYYEYVRENDITLTHTFIQPQVNRSQFYLEEPDEIIAARIVDKTKDGLVIQGARLLATQGGMTDEIMVFPSGARIPQFNGDHPHAYAFAIPNDTPGLKFICRESFDYGKSTYDHPLGSQFDEMDTLVVFNKVTVPWDRVFLHGNISLANRMYDESGFLPLTTHQIVSKNIVKTEFILGLVGSMINAISIGEYQHVQEKVSEILVSLEALKGFVLSSEIQAKENQWGVLLPNMEALHAAILYYPKIYPRLAEIIQLLGASGLVSIPTEADFKSEINEDVNKYLQTTQLDGKEKVKLFRLAWDLTMSAFGSRQTQYERYFFGDPIRLASNYFTQYDIKPYINQVKDFLDSY